MHVEAGVAEFDYGQLPTELACAGDDVRHDVGQTVCVLQNDLDHAVVFCVGSGVAKHCELDLVDVFGVEAEVLVGVFHQQEHARRDELVVVAEEAVDRVQVGCYPGHLGETMVVASDEQGVAGDKHVVVGAVSGMTTSVADELLVHLVELAVEHSVLLSECFLCQRHLLAPW